MVGNILFLILFLFFSCFCSCFFLQKRNTIGIFGILCLSVRDFPVPAFIPNPSAPSSGHPPPCAAALPLLSRAARHGLRPCSPAPLIATSSESQ